MQTENGTPRLLDDASGVRLSLDPRGRLTLTCPDGRHHAGVEPVRAFPISDPTCWISFCDSEGKEVLCLRSADTLVPEMRALLEEELAHREFVPVIKQIYRVSGEGTPSDWEVDTDRGRTRFTIDNEEDVRHLGPHRVLITDTRKLRYQLPDTRDLDSHSRRLLERFL